MRYLIACLAAAFALVLGISSLVAQEDSDGESQVCLAAPSASPAADAEATPAADEAAAGCVTVLLSEFEITMAAAVPAGEITFVATNVGEGPPHNLEIEGEDFEAVIAENLQSGQSGTLSVELEPGTYTVYCPVGQHRDRGMELELTVTE